QRLLKQSLEELHACILDIRNLVIRVKGSFFISTKIFRQTSERIESGEFTFRVFILSNEPSNGLSLCHTKFQIVDFRIKKLLPVHYPLIQRISFLIIPSTREIVVFNFFVPTCPE